MVIQPSALFSCWMRMSDKNILLFAFSIPAVLILACLDYHHHIVLVLRNTFQVFIVIYSTQRKLPWKLLGLNQNVLFYHNPLSNLF